MTAVADVVIVGAGMAGASLAAELAGRASVLLLEGESRPGYHSTGRSAAFLSETYGGPHIQPLTSASRRFLEDPPTDFSPEPFLSRRGALHIADSGGEAALDTLFRSFRRTVQLEPWYRFELLRMLPDLRDGWNLGLWEPSCADIDVARLHTTYLGRARAMGARLVTDAMVSEARREPGGWQVETAAGIFAGRVLVNAAGAWADRVAVSAGLSPLGIQPYRRTMAQLRVDPPPRRDLPLVIDALGRFYFKPEAGGRLWLSPHDETACEPCDCAAEEHDVALAIDRLEQVMDIRVEAVEHRWAGLRTFAPDRLPVYGYAPGREDFFWFAGQGGFGIQTAPAAAKIAAALLLETAPDPLVAQIDPRVYAPDRLLN
ncbi:MAG TPA: FAD-dependent oxidoreductase [Allosphingosinicella sp.]|nr:FAD-dependent oxidoreductase [Allosphingosinicella sp.]